MNLTKMFEMQKELDDYIVKTKGLEGQDLLPNTILALQVELGECCNEWRGFKHWSEDKEPRTENLLVEFVDCLHFILSIGIKIGHTSPPRENLQEDIVNAMEGFQHLFNWCVNLEYVISKGQLGNIFTAYERLIDVFFATGYHLGFSIPEIEQAYTNKWNINKQRQTNGY